MSPRFFTRGWSPRNRSWVKNGSGIRGGDRQDLGIAATAGGAHTEEVPTPRTIVLVAFDRLQLLDLAGPAEVFDAADRVAGGDRYRTWVATPGGERVRTTSGIELGGDGALADAPAEIDTLVVVGGRGSRKLLADEAFLAQLRTVAARARRVTSVCTGSLVLAAAGLLHERRATTHWASCDELAAIDSSITVIAATVASRLPVWPTMSPLGKLRRPKR